MRFSYASIASESFTKLFFLNQIVTKSSHCLLDIIATVAEVIWLLCKI